MTTALAVAATLGVVGFFLGTGGSMAITRRSGRRRAATGPPMACCLGCGAVLIVAEDPETRELRFVEKGARAFVLAFPGTLPGVLPEPIYPEAIPAPHYVEHRC